MPPAAVTAMRIILFLLASLLARVTGGSSALAHASLLHSTPADGNVLSEAPRSFVLTFNEPVSPVVMRLIDADGAGSELSKEETHGEPVAGSIVFSIGAPSASTVAVQTNTPPALVAAIWLARVLLYVGMFVGVGGRFFVAWIAPGQPLPRSV